MTDLTPGTPVFVQHAHGSADGFDLGFVTAYLGSGQLNGIGYDDATVVVMSTAPPSPAVTPTVANVRVWADRATAASARMPAGAGHLSGSRI